MDAAFDMNKAVEVADKLGSDGTKYCKWSVATLNSSDLETAISRILLNHGSHVPENISASKMWRVSLVAGDLIHQLSMGWSECNLKVRYSDEARRVSLNSGSALVKLMTARSKFDALAYQQTKWQEHGQRPNDPSSARDDVEVDPHKVLSAARGMMEATEVAGQLTIESENTSGCLHGNSPSKPPSLTNLAKLVEYMEKTPRLPSYIPAANMWGVTDEPASAQLEILSTMNACSLYAGEKKKARSLAEKSLQAYHRLTAAIATFDVLALRQTEWEERTATQKEGLIQEQ